MDHIKLLADIVLQTTNLASNEETAKNMDPFLRKEILKKTEEHKELLMKLCKPFQEGLENTRVQIKQETDKKDDAQHDIQDGLEGNTKNPNQDTD